MRAAWLARRKASVSSIGAAPSGHGWTSGLSQVSRRVPKAWSAYMTLQLPTWRAIDSMVRTEPLARTRHIEGSTVARLVISAWLSLEASMPGPWKASSIR